MDIFLSWGDLQILSLRKFIYVSSLLCLWYFEVIKKDKSLFFFFLTSGQAFIYLFFQEPVFCLGGDLYYYDTDT